MTYIASDPLHPDRAFAPGFFIRWEIVPTITQDIPVAQWQRKRLIIVRPKFDSWRGYHFIVRVQQGVRYVFVD